MNGRKNKNGGIFGSKGRVRAQLHPALVIEQVSRFHTPETRPAGTVHQPFISGACRRFKIQVPYAGTVFCKYPFSFPDLLLHKIPFPGMQQQGLVRGAAQQSNCIKVI
jgi:hypothetical protein